MDDDIEARLHSLLGVPATGGNRITVLRNGDEIFAAMLAGIDAATEAVDLVTFIYWAGEVAERFADSLSAAAERGCRVRVLLDAVGARRMSDDLTSGMRDAGVDVRFFRSPEKVLPFWPRDLNHRTHRKVLVCDGRVGFIGGVGIADEWAGDARDETEWRDSHVEVVGPAVAGLQAAFVDNWADRAQDGYDASHELAVDATPAGSSRCMVVAAGAEIGVTPMWRLAMTLVQLAQERIRITSAYFAPDAEIRAALIDAAARGVEVTILLPGPHADKRFVQLAGESDYAELIEGGVDIRSYQRSMLHAKVMTVDHDLATIGSANFDSRSTRHNEECNLIVLDPEIVERFDAHFDDDLELAVELDLSRWEDRSLGQRALERVSALGRRFW